MTAQKTAAEVEEQAQTMTQKIQEQSAQMALQAQMAKAEQDQIAQQVLEAQKAAQTTMLTTQQYEEKFAEVTHKMGQLETLLIAQRKKGIQLESQLSTAQDQIGGAERRAKALEEENARIKGEIQTWNDYYEQETGVVTSSAATISSPMISVSPTVMSEPYPLIPTLPMPIPPVSRTWSTIPHVGGVGASSSNVPSGGNPFMSAEDWQPISWDIPPVEQQMNERRVSFGSVFPGSNGGGNGGSVSAPQTQVQNRSSTTFNIGSKPKDPPCILWACEQRCGYVDR